MVSAMESPVVVWPATRRAMVRAGANQGKMTPRTCGSMAGCSIQTTQAVKPSCRRSP